ncbi:hypothetical protein GCM10011348_03430 [Marinobacterium nitratireducens]|uniref:Uncharacterized protein n=1 Tax=Marinobacterium nitratireducens TaxID=518897 RepID=A0A918DN52_9GAMM|nr:hypothetical protein GCM10011348_03430 [Marinobacterium nitratireducens]
MDSPSIGIYVPDWKLTQPIVKKEPIMEIMRIGLDLAKNVFEVFGVDEQEQQASAQGAQTQPGNEVLRSAPSLHCRDGKLRQCPPLGAKAAQLWP